MDRIWYGNVTRIDAVVADTIRQLVTTEETVIQAQETTHDLKAEISALNERLDRLIQIIRDGYDDGL